MLVCICAKQSEKPWRDQKWTRVSESLEKVGSIIIDYIIQLVLAVEATAIRSDGNCGLLLHVAHLFPLYLTSHP